MEFGLFGHLDLGLRYLDPDDDDEFEERVLPPFDVPLVLVTVG